LVNVAAGTDTAAVEKAGEITPVPHPSRFCVGGLVVICGGVVSVTTIFCVCEEALPTASTKCHVTVELPWVLRVRESVVVPVIVPEQLSVAVGGAVMVAEHCPVTSGNDATLGTGAIVSVTTIFWVCIEILPWPSSKCHVTVELPWVLCVRESVVVPVIVPEQLSVEVGGAVMVTEHCPVTSGNDATLGTGAIVSVTTIFWVCIEILPWPSSKCHVTVELPSVLRVRKSVVVPVIVT